MELLKEKSASGLKPKSLLNLYVLLQKMLNLAVALELLNSNPIQRVPKPKVQRAEKPSLSPAQVKAIAENMPANLKALVVLLYLTGAADWGGLGSEMVGCGLRSLEAVCPPFGVAQKRANPQE